VTSNDKGESDVTPTESETTRTAGNDPRGSWEIPETSPSRDVDRSEKARCHTADMYVSGKSDSPVVPEKQANNAGQPTAAESVEERGLTEKNAKQSPLNRTQSRGIRARGLYGVRTNRTKVRLWSSVFEVRAVCGNSARTDLCGGRPAMAVPTAIEELV